LCLYQGVQPVKLPCNLPGSSQAEAPHGAWLTLEVVVARQAAGTSGVASGCRDEAPAPVSPRGDAKRARGNGRGDGGSARTPQPPITDQHASRTAVLSSPKLLERVLTFLAGGKLEARRDLGRAALVCRSWREVATGDKVWERVVWQFMPAMEGRAYEVGARQCVLERGRCHYDRRAVVGDEWWVGIQLQVEIVDTLDEFRMFSAGGRMSPSTDADGRITGLRLSPDWDESVMTGPAFSVASRDPEQRMRFTDIGDVFSAPFVRIRIYVSNESSGRQALLWETRDGFELDCDEVEEDDYMCKHLPEGSRRVDYSFQTLYGPAFPRQGLPASVRLYVSPEAGQEGVAEVDKLWRVAGGDEDFTDLGASFFIVRFGEGATYDGVASSITRLLQP
jgi:hypothetical protein